MSSDFDPNKPDTTNGDFFCGKSKLPPRTRQSKNVKQKKKVIDEWKIIRPHEGHKFLLCLASMNSDAMWSSHIAGKRHIKNAIKYPNGLPKRGLDEEDSYDDSYDRPAKHIKSNDAPIWDDGYPPPEYMDDYYYEDDYYNHKPPMDYEPLVKPNVVFDYGHTKKLEDTAAPSLAPPPKPSILNEALSHGHPAPVPAPVPATAAAIVPPKLSFDKILQDFAKSAEADKQAQVKDDFFVKLNQREIAKDIAKEIAKKCFYQNENKSTVNEDPKQKPTIDVFEKYDKKKSSDIFDILHKHNERKLFEMAEEKKNVENSSFKKSLKKPKSKLDDFDPDDLTTDVLDDLLSAKLKSKKKDVPIKSNEIEIRKNIMKAEVNLDDPKVIAEKLEKLPTMLFLQLVHKKLVNLDLQNSDELKLLLKIVAEAQVVCCKKLPPNLQALVKTPVSGINKAPVQRTATFESQSAKPPVSLPIRNAAVSRNPTVSTATSVKNNMPVSVIPSVAPTPSVASTTVSPSQSQTVASVSAPVQNVAVSKSLINTIVPPPPPPIPTVAPPNPAFSVPPPPLVNPAALMYQMQGAMAVNQPPVFSGAPNTYPATWQNCQTNAIYNHYYSLFSMYKNAQTTQPNTSVCQQPLTLSKNQSPLPLPNAKEISNKEKSVIKPAQNVGTAKVLNKEMLEALKNLQALAEEFKKNIPGKKGK